MDKVEIYTIVIVVLTFGMYIFVGIKSKVSDTKTFFVANRGIPTVANGAAIAADWMSAASFISMAGLISFLGYDGSIYLMGWTGGFVLLTLLIAPYLRKYGKFTIPDFIGDRYQSDATRAVAAIATIFISLTYVAGQMRGIGIVFSRFLQVDIKTGVFVGMGIVAFFAVLGGMKGITWTQVVQFGVLIIAFLIPVFALSKKLTGIPIPQIALTATDITEKLSSIQVDLGLKEYLMPFQHYSKLNMFMMTAALMLGTAGLPHVIIRFYTVKTVKAARWSGVWALLFIAMLYTTAPALGAFAKYNLINSLNGKSVEELEKISWVQKWKNTGLLTLTDKNSDGTLNMGTGDTNEIIVDKDIIVLSTPEVANLSPFIIALVAAGGLAAALSTAAGLLLAMSSAVSHDIYYMIFRKDANEKERMLVARLAILAAVAAAGYFGINPPGFVGEVVALAFGLAAASIFPSILMGIFDKKMNKKGATSGIIAGLGFTLIMILLMKSNIILGTVKPVIDNFAGINAQGIGVIGMLLNISVSLTVSRLTEAPPENIQKLVEDIRIPVKI